VLFPDRGLSKRNPNWRTSATRTIAVDPQRCDMRTLPEPEGTPKTALEPVGL
jgi:hypothetical protein